jgi:hypothetical protein
MKICACSSEVATCWPRLLALEQRHQDAERAEQARAEIGDRDADPHRALSGQAGDRHQSAHALRDLVEARSVGVRSGLPETGNAGIDQLGIDLAQLRVVDAEPAFHVRAEILHHHVGLLHHALERRQGRGRLEIERHAALVAVQILEVRPFARAAQLIAAAPFGR